MTRTPVSRSKGQGHQAALLTAALTHQAAAAVTVGTYSSWENYCYVAVRRGRLGGASAPTDGGVAYRGGRPPAYSLFSLRRPNSVRTVQQIVCNTTTEKRVCSCTHNTTHCSVILHKTNTKVHCTIKVCNQFVIGISALHSFYTCYL